MCRYIGFFIIIILLLSCNNEKKTNKKNQLINKHFLTKIEAIKLKEDIYINYNKDLIVKRSQQMEDRKIVKRVRRL
tara:strand:- start:85 stop:312 length:228 start_codon:yes stop_codon:yes gene_type:complete